MCSNFTFFCHVLECKVFIALGKAVCFGWIFDILFRISSFDSFHEVEVTCELILHLYLSCDQICLIILTWLAMLLFDGKPIYTCCIQSLPKFSSPHKLFVRIFLRRLYNWRFKTSKLNLSILRESICLLNAHTWLIRDTCRICGSLLGPVCNFCSDVFI